MDHNEQLNQILSHSPNYFFLESARLSDPMIAGAESPSDVLFCLRLCSRVGSLLGSQDRFRRRSPALPPAAGDRSALLVPWPIPPSPPPAPTPRIPSHPIPGWIKQTNRGAACFLISVMQVKKTLSSTLTQLHYSSTNPNPKSKSISFLFHYIS